LIKRKGVKKTGSTYSKSSNLKQLYWLLGVLISLLILAKVISFFLALNLPISFKPIGPVFNWDQKSTVNLVFVSTNKTSETEQSLVSYNPKEQKITILEISPQTYGELPRGYGSWKIGSVYKLGQDENPPRGGVLLGQSISKLIGLPIDGLIILKKPLKTADLMIKIHNNKLEILSLLSAISSDLTPLQSSRLIWNLSEVRGDKVVSLNFLESNITDSKLLPDSSRVLGVNTVKLDLFIRDNLSDGIISQENESIAIYNGTTHPGLTQAVSRMLTNMGANVIFAANAQNQLEKTQITFAKDEKSLTAARLGQIFAPNCMPDSCRSVDPKVANSRAQINIVLGEDYYQEWYQR